MKERFSLCVAFVFFSLGMAQKAPCPCCTDAHRAFDFWIGTWQVANKDGSLAGTNTIEKAQDGCALIENWTSAKGNFTGTSTNFYNLKTKQWEQLWIDNSGEFLKLKGNRVGNRMILSSDEIESAEGKKYINRITWTLNEDGSVRQLWEVLQNGTVVKVAFDGLYTTTH